MPNFGLDPLPDIDFNIRCGNTLVGFANIDEITNQLAKKFGLFRTTEIYNELTNYLKTINITYERFKYLQLYQQDEAAEFKQAKKELQERLNTLNNQLNLLWFGEMELKNKDRFQAFLSTHQPFHWIAEFYEIMKNGGFDVIIGNPPYVEFPQTNKVYTTLSYQTLKTGNLYPLCVERSYQLQNGNSRFGMILPISAFSTKNMNPLMDYMDNNTNGLWLSFYHFRPSRLFDGGKGASIPTTIFITSHKSKKQHFSVGVKKFTPQTRPYLFNNLFYTPNQNNIRNHLNFCFPKLSNNIENEILAKVSINKPIISLKSQTPTSQKISYRSAGGLYWKIIINFPFPYESTSNKTNFFFSDINADVITAFLNSSLQWLLYTISFDTLNFADYFIFCLPFSYKELSATNKTKLKQLCKELMESYKSNAQHKMRGTTPCYEITANLSKPIIDEIDKVLAQHYGFTEEELDFIINYDIKYRMGDELNND